MSWNWIAKSQELNQKGLPFVLVNVIKSQGSTPREPGAKMIIIPGGDFYGSVGGGELEKLVLEDAQKVLTENQSLLKTYNLGLATNQCCGGIAEIFFEPINAGPQLIVFGAGHVGQAVMKTLEGTPFLLQAVDRREEWISQVPSHVVPHAQDWERVLEKTTWDKDKTYVLVMTHDHRLDEQIIEALLDKPTKFIGLIGSQTKWASFKGRLSSRGASPEDLRKITCPIGLETGGKAPQEIAVSVASQLLQIHYGKV